MKKMIAVFSLMLFTVGLIVVSNYAYAKNEGIPVLMYHNLTDSVVDGSNISPKRFQEHMNMLKEKGYTTITDYDLYEFLKGKKTLPKNPILITFDDGYKSNYVHAYPVLKKLGMKATVNLITSRVEDGSNRYPNETPKFSWDEARASQDVFLFQGHTNDLHYKAKNINGKFRGMITGRMHLKNKLETQKEFEARLLDDLIVSKKKIEKELGKEVITFVYPYGDYSKDTIKLAKKAGYKMAFTVKSGKVNRNHAKFYELNRITAHGNMSAKQLIQEINKY